METLCLSRTPLLIPVVRLKGLDKLLLRSSLMGPDGGTFHTTPFNFRSEQKMWKSHPVERSRKKEKKEERIYVHYTNVSQINHHFRWQIIIKKVKNEEILPRRKSEFGWAYNGEKGKIESQSQVIFIEPKPAQETLNQLNTRLGLAT